jgi:hypothetical protein
MDNIFFRSVVFVIVTAFSGGVWLHSRRRLPSAHRFLVDYTLGMYTLTYAVGCAILYLFQYDYLFRFYGNSVFFPMRTSFELVLLLAALPFMVIPVAVRMMLSFVRVPIAELSPNPIRTETKLIGLVLVLIPSLALIAPIAFELISNALGDLLTTSSAALLYSQRALVFEKVSFLQGGIVYSVLPVISAILLFWQGDGSKWILRVMGISLAILATLLNLGMFQIGPTLSFLLTCAFCYIVRQNGRVSLTTATTTAVGGSVVLGLYSVIKTSGTELSQAELFLMRLPLPLPYLIQFASEKPAGGVQITSLPLDLGEYMFPELRAAQRFVAMPQPAFVDAWFTYNPIVSLFVLMLVAALIVFLGNRMTKAGFGRTPSDPQLILWAVIAAPSLYYFFQVDIVSMFTSAYSIALVSLPVAAIFFVHAWPRKYDGTANHNHLHTRGRP